MFYKISARGIFHSTCTIQRKSSTPKRILIKIYLNGIVENPKLEPCETVCVTLKVKQCRSVDFLRTWPKEANFKSDFPYLDRG
jgi:hypothetical protein